MALWDDQALRRPRDYQRRRNLSIRFRTFQEIGDLQMHYAARLETGYVDNDPLTNLADQSGNSNTASQATSGKRALYKTNIINGLPAYLFDGTDDFYDLPNVMTTWTTGEIFIVLKRAADPPGTQATSGLWKMDTAVQASNVPFTSGVIFDAWGSDSRKTTVDPTPSLASPALYNVTSGPSNWTSRLNGAILFGTATNTVGFNTAPQLGRSFDGLSTEAFMNGHISECLIYKKTLTASQRDSVEEALGLLYGITIS